MEQAEEIKNSIQALGEMTSQSSITPFGLALILQAIMSFVESLELKPKSEVDVLAQITQALNAANSALSAANTANSNAQKCVVVTFSMEQTAAGGVKLKLKQAGYSEKTVTLPEANETAPGLLTPQVLTLIADTAEAVLNNRVTSITATATKKGLTIGLVSKGGTLEKALPSATQTTAGIMLADDKLKLDSLPGASAIARINDGGCLLFTQCPPIVLLKVDESPLDDDPAVGDAWLDSGHIWYVKDSATTVDLGAPSQHLIFVHKPTGLQYRWTGSSMELIGSDPRGGLDVVDVTCASVSRKTYNVPAGVLCRLKPTTDTANIVLQSGTSGKSPIHRILVERSDISTLGTDTNQGLQWPASLIWPSGTIPGVAHVMDAEAIMVTIVNRRYASFTEFG